MIHSVQVANAPIEARITIPGSKSITHRALLLSALADGVSELSGILISDDILTFVNALHELGIIISLDKSTRSCIIGGGGGQFPKRAASVWCDDAGTIGPFLLAACASTAGVYAFDGSEQVRAQPIASLLRALSVLGARMIPEDSMHMPFTLTGIDGLKGGEIEVDASETGQFVSALLMIAPLAKKPLVIQFEDIVSEPYLDMTCHMMAEFGVLVQRMHSARFSVPIPQRYQARDYIIEPDLTTASYFFAAAAVTGGQITIQSVNRLESKQNDIEFLVVLEKMGCTVIESNNGLTVQGPSELKGVNVDMRHFSDTAMTLAACAPFAKTPTTITNIGHLRQKGADRIAVMHSELEKLRVKVEEGKDWLKIYPSIPSPATVDSHNDPHIAMAFNIIGLRVPGININGEKSVNKFCPQFFELWNILLPRPIN